MIDNNELESALDKSETIQYIVKTLETLGEVVIELKQHEERTKND